LENLEWISSLKQEGKIENINMVFVVHKLNYKDMPDFVKMAENYNALASFRYYRQWAHNTEFKYKDMAVFEPEHPEYPELVKILQDSVFDSSHCSLDPKLKSIRNSY
jgi:MoaA/NifB/PqqE/SkfB family radical SAM enzyme